MNAYNEMKYPKWLERRMQLHRDWVSERTRVMDRAGIRNTFLTYNGLTLTTAEWERKMGFPHNTIRGRIRICGWSAEKAITTPIRKRVKR